MNHDLSGESPSIAPEYLLRDLAILKSELEVFSGKRPIEAARINRLISEHTGNLQSTFESM